MNWLKFGGIAVAILIVVFVTHHYDSAIYQVAKDKAVADQVVADTGTCDKQKALTKETQDGIQKDLADVKRKLAIAKRVQPATCVHVLAGSGADVAGVLGGHATEGRVGLSSDWLHDYFATCESIHRTLNRCEQLVHDERVKP